MKIAVPRMDGSDVAISSGAGSRLYDIASDPWQLRLVDDPAAEARMISLMRGLMEANNAPEEQYRRPGLA